VEVGRKDLSIRASIKPTVKAIGKRIKEIENKVLEHKVIKPKDQIIYQCVQHTIKVSPECMNSEMVYGSVKTLEGNPVSLHNYYNTLIEEDHSDVEKYHLSFYDPYEVDGFVTKIEARAIKKYKDEKREKKIKMKKTETKKESPNIKIESVKTQSKSSLSIHDLSKMDIPSDDDDPISDDEENSGTKYLKGGHFNVDSHNCIFYNNRMMRMYKNKLMTFVWYIIAVCFMWLSLLKILPAEVLFITTFASLIVSIPGICLLNKDLLRELSVRFEYLYLNVNLLIHIISMCTMFNDMRMILCLSALTLMIVVINYDARPGPEVVGLDMYLKRPIMGTLLLMTTLTGLIPCVYLSVIETNLLTINIGGIFLVNNHLIWSSTALTIILFSVKNVLKSVRGDLAIIHKNVSLINHTDESLLA
jgi:hypothetical protein